MKIRSYCDVSIPCIHVLHAVSSIWKKFVQNHRSCNKQKSQWFDVEYGIYFTRETAFFIFSLVLSTQENIKMPCHVWNKFRLSTSNHWIFCIYQNEWFYRIWRQTCGNQFYVSQPPFTCELEYWNYLFPFPRWLFYANQSRKEKQSGNNADAVLNDFTDLEKRKDLNNDWRNISLDSSDDAILILQNTKITTCDVQGCVAGANKSQTTYENIYH